MNNIALYIGCIVVPICAVFSNLTLRHWVKSPSTAGADLLLFLLTLDATVLIANKDFKYLIQEPIFQNEIIAIFVGFIFVGFWVWISNVVYFEKKVLKSFNSITGSYENYPLRWVITSWAIIVALTSAHFLIFSMKANG